MENTEILRHYALSFLGVPYRFGGRNRLEGLDCSQFVTELLISAGMLPYGSDLRAQDLFKRFGPFTDGPHSFGDLALFGSSSNSIVHVGFCLNDQLMIEAGGGESTTISLASAVERSACVRIRTIRYRKDFLGRVSLQYK